ncbi:hypothetical protein EJ110_NYTH20074 [Nymphaea thermarum]|nr:hypothetical protein EJ110_NYTH20074 [Nymphaea thermarum]
MQVITMEDSGPSRENFTWTEGQMDSLVQLLLEQSHIPGMKSGGGLKSKAYITIEENMIDHFGREFTKNKIKNKLKHTKPNLTVMKIFINTSGFGYNPFNKCVDVDPKFGVSTLRNIRIEKSTKVQNYGGDVNSVKQVQ